MVQVRLSDTFEVKKCIIGQPSKVCMRSSFLRYLFIHAISKRRHRLSTRSSFSLNWLDNLIGVNHPGPHFTVLDLFIYIWLIAMLFKDSKFAYNYGLTKYIRREANVLSAFLQISFFIAYAFKSFAWVNCRRVMATHNVLGQVRAT